MKSKTPLSALLVFIFCGLSLQSLQAQEIGVNLGTLLNTYETNNSFFTMQQVGPDATGNAEFDVETSFGREFGLSYTMELSLFWDFEIALNFQKQNSTIVRSFDLPPSEDFQDLRLEMQENSISLTPRIYYKINRVFSAYTGVNVRFSTQGVSYAFASENPELEIFPTGTGGFIRQDITAAEYNYLDVELGVTARFPFGINVYAGYWRTAVDFQAHFNTFVRPTGAFRLGVGYKIATEKLSPYIKE